MDEQKQMEKLNKLLELLNDGKANEDEIIVAFQVVFQILQEMQASHDEKMAQQGSRMDDSHKEACDMINECEQRMKDLYAKFKEKVAGDIRDVAAQASKNVKELEAKIPSPTDLSSIEARLNALETPEPEEPDDPYEARNELEAIDNESEKLKIEAIQNLRKELDEIKKSIKSSGGRTIFGGGFNYSAMSLHIVDDETPSGAINGSNTVFTLANVPSPASSLKVYLNGARQRITEDYTLSGGTITFTIAPLTGSILLVDYRN